MMDTRQRQRGEYVTPRQKKKLIGLMAQNPQLISCKFTQDFNYKDSQKLWQNIANQCNAIQGAKKTWCQWRKTWHDIRSKVKKKLASSGEVPSLFTMLTAAEQEALGFKNVSSTTNYQESTEFVPMDMHDDIQNSFDNDDVDPTASLSESESLVEEKVFTHSEKKNKKFKNSKKDSRHSDNCVFNCDLLAVQEERKLQIKEDYYNFKKDYLKQKLLLMKEQNEALKSIAQNLAENK